MKEASIAMAEAKWAAGDVAQDLVSWNDGIRRKVRDNVNQASEVVEVHIDNVAGVKLPIFKSKHRDVVSDELTLARGGQR